MVRKLNESNVEYTNELDALKAGLRDTYRDTNRVTVDVVTTPKRALRVDILSNSGELAEELFIFNGSDGVLKARTFDGKMYKFVDTDGVFNLLDDLLRQYEYESVRRRSKKQVSEAYTRVISDESGRMHSAIDSQIETIRLMMSEITEKLDLVDKYERNLHIDGRADEDLYDVLFNSKKVLRKFSEVLDDFCDNSFDWLCWETKAGY